jgi:class 3 adenylate cyclase
MTYSTSIRIPQLAAGSFSETTLLLAFADLTAYTATTRRLGNWDVAALMQGLYERATTIVEAGGGRVVKFIGDAAFIVFPEQLAETGVLTLLRYKHDLDTWLEAIDYPGRVLVKVHLGTGIAGQFGPQHNARYDVIGADVNLTAVLESRGFAITAQAFRALGAAARKQFKKHTPPITYIPVEQPH